MADSTQSTNPPDLGDDGPSTHNPTGRETHAHYHSARALQHNPNSPDVSQWPPPSAGQGVNQPGPDLPQTVGTGFLGAQISDTAGYIPPDSMGAVGPSQILVIVNGRVKIFSKSGVVGGLNTDTDSFFSSVRSAGTSDPRAYYDRLSQRWFICMIDVATPNRVLLAVSSGSTISSSSSFTFFQFQHDLVGATPNSDTGGFADYPSLGVDKFALYIGVDVFNAAGNALIGTTGFVVNKSNLLSGTLTVTAFRQIGSINGGGSGPWAPQGVCNDDPAATEGYFIAPDNVTLSRLTFRRITNPGGTPSISSTITITVPTTAYPVPQAHKGNTIPKSLDSLDDRIFEAVIHKNQITGASTMWCAQNIQVNSSGVGSSSGGRNGSRWYQITNLTTTPSLVQSGTLYDSAASNPRGFWIPSVAVSGQGHMALGCSYAGSNDFAGVAVAGRLRTDALGTTEAATLAVVSSTAYNIGESPNPHRWGDFSRTALDPTDDMTMWTFQEYCNSANSWGVRVVQLKAPLPATPTNPIPATLAAGLASTNVTVSGLSLSGSEFYDPGSDPGGPGYSNHIGAAVNGGGVTVNSVTFVNPTNITLNLTVSASAAAGTRTITVINPDGQSVTSSAILTIATPPSITSQPTNQTVGQGANASFSVVAGGTAPFSYQWRFNGSVIPGASGSSYTRSNAACSDAGGFDVVVTNALGSVTSSVAVLTVVAPPVIAVPPASLVVATGQPAMFSASATNQCGAAPTYQWQLGGTNLAGATSNTFSIASAQVSEAGNYTVVASNLGGAVTSIIATLTVQFPPSILSNPQSQTLPLGSNAHFSVTASGNPVLSYQWRFNSSVIPGATTSTYARTNVQCSDAGSFDVAVTNAGGSVTSSVAVLAVVGPPVFSIPPSNLTVPAGQPADFSAMATNQCGNAPTYQWRFGETNLAGATSNSYTVASAQLSDAGSYSVVASNLGGSITSAVASLTVLLPPVIATNPLSQTLAMGQNAGFSVTGSGTPPPAYQWRLNSSSIPGATDSSYTRTNVQCGDAGSFDVVLTNSGGAVTSSVATLSVVSPPAFSIPPGNLSVLVGQPATFSALATNQCGSGPTYQWQFGGTNLAGATSNSFSIASAQATNAGGYAVIAANLGGSVTSSLAILTVLVSPVVVTNPHDLTLSQGSTAMFSVTGSGSPPPAYQWRLNSSPIPGATDSSYTRTNVQCGDAGGFDVVLTNSGGAVTGSVATLSVVSPPAFSIPPGNLSVLVGQPATFSALATNQCGSGPTYQWQFGGTNLVGATSNSFTIASAQLSDAGNYSVMASNLGGSVTSAVASLTVWVPPVIATNPQSQTLAMGQSAAFSVTASGTPPPAYQWRLNSSPIPGATDSSYTRTNVQCGDAGGFDVVLTNAGGAVTSSVAILTVVSPPVISSPPTNLTVLAGQPAAFSALATNQCGSAPAYQWQFGGTNLAGATSNSFTIASVQLSDAGDYAVVASNLSGSVTSSIATLTVGVPPSITVNPQSQIVALNNDANFSVTATGIPAPVYQWRFNSSVIAGATASAYSGTNAQCADAGGYDVLVSNTAGAATSSVASLVVVSPPTITLSPTNLTVLSGQPAVFSSAASEPCAGILSYQWVFGGSNILAATNSSFTISNSQPADAGSYSVAVTNLAGSATSAVAVLTVIAPVVADFGANPTNGSPPLAVQFTNLSAGATGYSWDFGDGQSSTDTNPVNVYTNVGAYTVQLTAIGPGGTNVLTRTNFIQVLESLLVLYVAPLDSTNFIFSFPTLPGKTYQVQYKDFLDDPVWQDLLSVPGDGTFKFVTNSSAQPAQRVYRVQAQ